MLAKLKRISKALGAAAPLAAVFVAEVTGAFDAVAEDEVITFNEWYLLIGAVVSAAGAYFAPKNAEPAPPV